MKVITIHWPLHPEKDYAWYKGEVDRADNADDIARELDLSFVDSVENAIYGHNFSYAINTGDVMEYLDPTVPVCRGWDFGQYPAVIWAQVIGGIMYCFKEFVPLTAGGTNVHDFIPNVFTLSNQMFPNATFYEVVDIAAKQRKHHEKSKEKIKSDIDFMKEYAKTFGSTLTIQTKKVFIEPGINLVNSILKNNLILVDRSMSNTITAFQGGYKRKRQMGERKTAGPAETHPDEDVMLLFVPPSL